MSCPSYKCPRCNYSNDRKNNLERHLNKTVPCPNINNVELTNEVKEAALKPLSRNKRNGAVQGNRNVTMSGSENTSAHGETNVIGNQNHVIQRPIFHLYQQYHQPPPMFVFVGSHTDPFSTFEKVQMLDEYFGIQRQERLTLKQLKLQRSRKRRTLYEMYNFFSNTKRYRALNDNDVIKEATYIMMIRKFDSDITRRSLVSNLIAISDYHHFIVYFVDKNGEWKRVHLKEFIHEIINEFYPFATLNEEYLAKFIYYTKYVGDPSLCRKAESLLIELYSFMLCMQWTPRTKDLTQEELFDTMIYDSEAHPDFEYVPEGRMIGQKCDELYREAIARTTEDKRESVYKNVISNLEDLAIKCFAGKIADIHNLFEEKSKDDARFRKIMENYYNQKKVDGDLDPFNIDMPDLVDDDDIDIIPLSDREKTKYGIRV